MSVETTAQTPRQPVLDALVTRLEALAVDQLTVYPGEVDPAPPTLVTAGQPDPSGRVAPYAVVWGATGRPDPNPNLGATSGGTARTGDSILSGQITFAAGYLNDLLAVLDEVIPLLQLWVPTIDGLECGPLRQQPGFDAGPPRLDERVRPPRWMSPWMWRLHVASSPTAP